MAFHYMAGGITRGHAAVQFYEAFSEGDFDRLADLTGEGFRDHSLGESLDAIGMRRSMEELRRRFLDFKARIEDMIEAVDQERVAVLWVLEGTYQEVLDVPSPRRRVSVDVPSLPRRVSVNALDMLRIEGNEIVERWSVVDYLQLFRQLGFAVPEM